MLVTISFYRKNCYRKSRSPSGKPPEKEYSTILSQPIVLLKKKFTKESRSVRYWEIDAILLLAENILTIRTYPDFGFVNLLAHINPKWRFTIFIIYIL